MLRGPRPTPTHLRLLRGNPGKRAIPEEPEPQVPAKCPEPPEHLVGYACDEWYRIAPELHRLGLLTVADIGPLAAYCYAYGQWRSAAEILTKIADNDPVMQGLLIRRDGQAVPSLAEVLRSEKSSAAQNRNRSGSRARARRRGIRTRAEGCVEPLLR
jgi:P27 family predicted phage terminase small subunit